MYYKKSGLVVSSSAAVPTDPVALGDDNAAFLELWVVSGSGQVTATLYGSNDLVNWSTLSKSATNGAGSPNVPKYATETAGSTQTAVIPYSHVQAQVTNTGGPALVEVAIRTFRTT